MKGIVITTSEYTKDFLKPCLDSIKKTQYTILVVSNDKYIPKVPHGIKLVVNNWNGWELSGIQRGKETFHEFVHLMDTTVVKDISLFDKLFSLQGNIVLTKGNYHYMGKFVTKDLPDIPKINSKEEGIRLERFWLKDYKEFSPDLPVHTNKFEVIHNQHRMKLENDYLIKWKGTYSI